MSTTPTPPGGSVGTTLGGILTVLVESNQVVQIGIEIAGVLIPLVTAVVKKIEDIGQGNATVTFDTVVLSDLAELATIEELTAEDVAAVNAELARLGLPQLPPLPPAAAPAGD